MKKKLVVAGIIIMLLIIVGVVTYTLPKQHKKTIHALSYQLGTENQSEVNIHIDGELKKSLTGKRTFSGVIEIEGEEIPVPEGERNVEIHFSKDGIGHIVYTYFENGQPKTYSYGSIFINNDFSKVTILKGSWNTKEGEMITGPAKNRREALHISNELMAAFLKGRTLIN